MALIVCPECEHKVSDAAVSCPSCGHPMQPIAADAGKASTGGVEPGVAQSGRRELFKAGDSNFVLSEVAAVSCIKTRSWVWMFIGLPLVAAIIFSWLQLAWPYALGVSIVAMVLLGILYVDQGIIASTGSVTDIDEDMGQVNQRYLDAMKGQSLVLYQGGNSCLNMSFAINPERVAEFKQQSSLGHIWLYLLGMGCIAAGYFYPLPSLNLQEAVSLPLLYLPGGLALLLGLLTRKAALEVVGVGGAKVRLHTRCGDVKRVVNELAGHIQGQVNASETDAAA